jgi:hypothetical protein
LKSRTYAVAVIIAGAGLFLLVLLTNATVDPQAVLGTGLIANPINANDRYLRMVDYEKASARFDGLVFGSSRATAIPRAELSRRMGADFANFAVVFGLLEDHLPVLEYVLRTKKARQERLRAVFVLLDIDTFGANPATNRNLQFLLPPVLTGESPMRFRWKYLTAIQFGAWRGEIARATNRRRSAAALVDQAPRPIDPPVTKPAANDPQLATPPVSTSQVTSLEVAAPAPPLPALQGEGFSVTDEEFARQLELLRHFVMLCRERGVRLVVATTPLHRHIATLYGADALTRRRQQIAMVVPFWDFDSPDWLSDRPDLWWDDSHFTEAVGNMMLDVIFGTETSSVPANFGRLYGK